ncbi:MAG TPA: hypothetical protein VKA65_02030 [Acidimicrobiales bacterium]|nr:hypothetical protein [Acidimicrobiales bacterium]
MTGWPTAPGGHPRSGRTRRAGRRSAWALAAALVATLAGVALPSAAGAAPAQDAPEDGAAGRVVVVSLPTLRWADLEDADTPRIDEVLGRSAVASMSVRSIGPTTEAGEAYATIGAGNRAAAQVEVAGMAYEPSFSMEWGTAGEVFERRSGDDLQGASVVHLGMAQITSRADAMLYGAEPGALGEAVRDAGLRTAVVANADLPDVDGREAALALVDRDGRVDGGSVSLDLLSFDAASPYGIRLDPETTGQAVTRAVADSDVVLVEASDLARLDAYRPWMSSRARSQALERTLAATDELVGRVVDQLDPSRDTLMLVGPYGPAHLGDGSIENLTVFALSGPDVEPGLARSGTTRRAGYVTLTDIAPTILDRLDIGEPDSMNGTAITSAGGGAPDADDVAGLADLNDLATFRDRAVGPVSVVYIVLQVVVYGIAVLALWRPRPRLGVVALAGSLVVLAIPPVVFLSGLLPYEDLSVGAYAVAVVAAAAVLAGVTWVLTKRHLLGPPLALIGLSLAVMLVDVATGGRLQINTVFGYSPIVAGRFAGFGNLSFSLTAIAAIAVATGVWALPRLRGRDGTPVEGVPRRGWPLALAAVVLAVTIVFDGLPSIGSDVGGVLASGPAFAVVLLLLAGARVDVRRLVVIGVATLAGLALFAGLDLARPAEERTHLGRFVESITGGGAGTILGRKLQSNVSILTSSVWTWLVPVGLAFLAFLTWRSRGLLQRLQDRVPGLRAFLVGGLVVATLGLAVNDSGVAIPAMMFGVALPYLAYLVLRTTPALAGAAAGRAGRTDVPTDGPAADDDRPATVPASPHVAQAVPPDEPAPAVDAGARR